MTKKHYEQFAREIAAFVRFSDDTPERTQGYATFAMRIIARVAAADNPAFNRDRFKHACGITE